MKCGTCGNELPQGAQSCPWCGAPVTYGQPSAYPQGYAQYQPYPAGYQQPYGYGQPAPERRTLLTAVSELPRAFAESFTRPGEVLRALVEKRDFISCPVVCALAVLFAFLVGMVTMRGLVGALFSVVTRLTGVSMAGTSASMNQGIRYIVGRVGPSVGGIAALCQAVCMLVSTAVFITYVCGVRHITFSWGLCLNFLTVLSLSVPVTSLLSMALSFLSPWLALLPLACDAVVSFLQVGDMLAVIIGQEERQLLRAHVVCVALSVALTVTLCGLLGGWLMGGVMNRVLALMSTVGSLV